MNTKKLFLTAAALFLVADLLSANPYDDLAGGLTDPVELAGKSVAVASFDSETDEQTGRAVADELTEAFTRADISVVERKDLDKVYEELKLQLSGVVSNESGAELGEAAGASYIVLGTVREVQKPGYRNKGLKIQARMVDVSSNEVVSTASTTVEQSDMTSPYRRREVRGAVEYPSLLDFRVGGNLYTTYYTDEEIEIEESEGPGFELGFACSGKTEGFFARRWEFLYGMDTQEEESVVLRSHKFAFGRSYLIRIPMWRYFETLSYLSHAYFGLQGASTLSYTCGDVDDFWGFHLKACALGGWSTGLSDFLNLFAEYRYNFKLFNIGWEGFGAEELSGVDSFKLSGHQLHIGISLAP